jgi:glycosyltransferase involved in cell wall biosynthesis
MSRLLFINQYYWPDEAATAQLLADLAGALAQDGHSVTVVCGRSRYLCAQQLESGSSVHEGVRIERVGGSDWGRRRMGGRLTDNVTFLAAAWGRLSSLPKQDLVVAMSSPPWVGRLGVWHHRRCGVPLVLWLQDIYPEVAERLGVMRNRLLARILRAQSTAMYRACARIVVPAESMAATLRGQGISDGVLRVIPNWANLDEIGAGAVCANRFRKEQGWASDRVLMYSGNMGAAHDTETMLTLVTLLQKEVSSMRFVLVGDSPRHARFMDDLKKRNFDRGSWLPSQPRARLGELLGAADAHLVSQRVETEGVLFPSKFYGAVAAGRPVIFVGARSSEMGRQVLDDGLGTVVEPGCATAETAAAAKTLSMAQAGDDTVARIRQWAERNASHRVRLAQFGGMLREALS